MRPCAADFRGAQTEVEALKRRINADQKKLSEDSLRAYAAMAEDLDLGAPLALLDPAIPIQPALLASIYDTEGSETGRRFKTDDEARTFAGEHIDGWLAEIQRAKAEEHREAQLRTEESERRRLEGVINVFSNNGIPARLLEGLFLRASAAEQLAAKLEERDRLADRIRELEDKRER